MTEKKKLLQKHELCTKEVHIMNFWWRKPWYYGFMGVKGIFFNAGSW